MLADLIDVARPGEEVEVTGIYQHTFEPGQNIRTGACRSRGLAPFSVLAASAGLTVRVSARSPALQILTLARLLRAALPNSASSAGFPVFGTTIEANYIQKKSDSSASQNINEEDKK